MGLQMNLILEWYWLTSMLPGEGKTFNSFNLSLILSAAGKKVLLVDFDLHKPRVHRAVGLSNKYGTSNRFNQNKKAWMRWCKSTPFENLSVISSGPIPPNASELVVRESTQ